LNRNGLCRRWNAGEEGTPMLRVVTDDDAGAEMRAGLDEIVLEGAQRMLAAALDAEADAYIACLAGELDGRGRRLVVRNGHAEPRTITTAAGRIEVTAPRINDKRVDETGERYRFRSSILPPWARKSPKVAEVLPLMYLHGMSGGDFRAGAGRVLRLGCRAVGGCDHQADDAVAGRAACLRRGGPVRARLRVRVGRRLHFNVRLAEERLCCLVIVGVRVDGTKELVAITDGYRESTESWADLLRDLIWGALREVFPDTRGQRCWVHKAANVLNALPKSAQPTARRMLTEIRDAEDREHGRCRG
jgi:transposase-like protein